MVYHKGPDNDSIGLDDGQIYYVHVVDATTIQLSLIAGGQVVDLTPPTTTATESDRLTPVGNVVQLTSAAYATDIVVDAGDGNDTVKSGVAGAVNRSLPSTAYLLEDFVFTYTSVSYTHLTLPTNREV
mgnify:CR=1 FL=1